MGFSDSSVGKESPCSAGDLGWQDSLEKEMATHPSILTWKISWTEEPGGLQSMGLVAVHRLLLIVVASFRAQALGPKLNRYARVLLLHWLWDLP